jgi:hypothetical protein
VSKLQRHRCPTFGALRFRTRRGQTGRYIFIYIDSYPRNITPLWSSGQSSWLHNGDVLCHLWGTKWIYICYVEESRPPLWSSGQSSWLHNGDVLCFLWGTNWIYMLCRKKYLASIAQCRHWEIPAISVSAFWYPQYDRKKCSTFVRTKNVQFWASDPTFN